MSRARSSSDILFALPLEEVAAGFRWEKARTIKWLRDHDVDYLAGTDRIPVAAIQAAIAKAAGLNNDAPGTEPSGDPYLEALKDG